MGYTLHFAYRSIAVLTATLASVRVLNAACTDALTFTVPFTTMVRTNVSQEELYGFVPYRIPKRTSMSRWRPPSAPVSPVASRCTPNRCRTAHRGRCRTGGR